MKQILLIVVITLCATSAESAADVGVSVSVGQPVFMAVLTSVTICNLNFLMQSPSSSIPLRPAWFINTSTSTFHQGMRRSGANIVLNIMPAGAPSIS